MFETVTPNGSNEPKDIFQEVEPVVPAPVSPQPIPSVAPAPAAVPSPALGGIVAGQGGGPKEPLASLSQLGEARHSRFWPVFTTVVIILILVVAGWYAYARFLNKQIIPQELPVTPQNEQPVIPEIIPTTTGDEILLEGATTTQPTTTDPLTPQVMDTDRDGLSDSEEQILGTSIIDPDTDQDELFDREEVVVYRTNPLNPDTDGDGYKDGNEVKNNYDPLGPGRLRNLAPALETSSLPAQPR